MSSGYRANPDDHSPKCSEGSTDPWRSNSNQLEKFGSKPSTIAVLGTPA